MTIYSLMPSGRKAVLVLAAAEESERILKWLTASSSAKPEPAVAATVIYQPRNRKREVENCCPIASLLSHICVDESGRKLLESIDPGCEFLEVQVPEKGFFIYRASLTVDPVESGWVEATDGRRRLKAPVFRPDVELPRIFRLPLVYEAAGDTMCTDEIIRTLIASKMSGFCAWNFQMRQEQHL